MRNFSLAQRNTGRLSANTAIIPGCVKLPQARLSHHLSPMLLSPYAPNILTPCPYGPITLYDYHTNALLLYPHHLRPYHDNTLHICSYVAPPGDGRVAETGPPSAHDPDPRADDPDTDTHT